MNNWERMKERKKIVCDTKDKIFENKDEKLENKIK